MADLVFVEFKDELKGIKMHIQCGKNHLIALQPCAQAVLKKQDDPFENSLPFYGKHGHQVVLEKSEKIVNRLRKDFILKDNLDVSSAYERTFFFYFRLYLHHWLFLLEVIDRAVEKYYPVRLVVPPADALEGVSLQLRKNDRLLGEVASRYANSHGMHVSMGKTNKRYKINKNTFPVWLRRIVFEFLLAGFRWKTRNRSVILATADTYNMPRLVEDIQEHLKQDLPVYLSFRKTRAREIFREMRTGRSWSFPFLPIRAPSQEVQNFRIQLDQCLRHLREVIGQNREIFMFHGVDLSEPLTTYIQHALLPEMVRLHGQVYALGRILEAREPSIVLSQHSLGIGYALGELCRARNIPGLLISHGSHVPHQEKHAELEWDEHARTLMNTHYPYVAAQTPWARAFLEKQKELLSQPITTGPLLLSRVDKVKQKENKEQLRERLYAGVKSDIIVLHAGTHKPREGIRPFVYETVDEYISNINDLIRAAKKVPGMFLAVRFRPSESLTIDELRNLVIQSDCYEIYTEGTFDEYLYTADLLVSYSSTTIEEALQNQVPVLLYDPDGMYSHIPAEVIKEGREPKVSPIYFATGWDSLFWGLYWFREHLLSGAELDEGVWKQHSISIDKKLSWLNQLKVSQQ